MTEMIFALKDAPRQRVDLSPLTPNRLASLSLSEIKDLRLSAGKKQWRVSDLFELSGDNSQQLVFRNSCSKLDYLGRDMRAGRIVVEGSIGAYLGLGMRSGRIIVNGDTGVLTGCEMQGGFVQINGSAGDFLGGALPGNKRGMAGGMIVVRGDAGDRAGDQMRRGIILVEGNSGDYCGSRMIAGTIAVMGSTGDYAGYGMNRGTLLLWNNPRLLPTFVDCGSHTLSSFLPLLFRSFRSLDSKFADIDEEFHRIRRYGGDMACVGRGEILIKEER